MSDYSASLSSQGQYQSGPSPFPTQRGGSREEKTPCNLATSDQRNINNSNSSTKLTPLGLMGGYSDYSDRRDRDRDKNNSEFNKSLLDFDNEMRSRSSRVALFDRSAISPGMTPLHSNEVKMSPA